MQEFQTEQEKFWAGNFGDDYSVRNAGAQILESNVSMFSRILSHCGDAKSLLEFGANTGLNLRAISHIRPNLALDAIEINQSAAEKLEEWGGVRNIYRGSILEFEENESWDVALIKGVLIHINPEHLQQVYERLYNASNRYIVVAEYFNSTPVEIQYRGHSGKLFKRDFAGEILDNYPDLRVIDYGFAWRRDPKFPQDDITWFVLEKQ